MIKFYGKIKIATLRQLIQSYITNKKELVEILLCMNGNKFEDCVEKMNYQLETGDYYIEKYNIKILNIDGIRISIILSTGIPYDLIKAYPIYV